MAEKDGDVHMVRGMFHNAAAEGGWNLEREWPFGQYSAGYMPVKSGLGIIRACARLYWQDKLPRKEADLVLYAQEEAWLKEWSEGIRRSSYCECSHNQVAHGIGEEGEEKKGLGAGRKCQECECEDFRYSAEQTEKHAQVAVGVEKRGAKLTQTRPNGLN